MKAEYIDHMGDDLTVVNAARVSFDKESEWEWECSACNDNREECWLHDDVCGMDGKPILGTAVLNEKDKRLIKYLAKHNHWTPFGHCSITIRETVPIFVARQRFKHTVGFVYNEVSRRYVDDEPEFYYPDIWRERAQDKKQGSKTTPLKGYTKDITATYEQYIRDVIELYQYMIDIGVAPEQARMVLPQSMYTSYYCTGSLAAWARAYNLRSKPDAQQEMQDLAMSWNDVVQPLFPVSWAALTEGGGAT